MLTSRGIYMLAGFARRRLEDFANTNRPTSATQRQGKRDERGSRAVKAKAWRLEDSLFDGPR